MWKTYYKIIELQMKNLVYNISYYMITQFITEGNSCVCLYKTAHKKATPDSRHTGAAGRALCQNNRAASRLLL